MVDLDSLADPNPPGILLPLSSQCCGYRHAPPHPAAVDWTWMLEIALRSSGLFCKHGTSYLPGLLAPSFWPYLPLLYQPPDNFLNIRASQRPVPEPWLLIWSSFESVLLLRHSLLGHGDPNWNSLPSSCILLTVHLFSIASILEACCGLWL